MPIYEYNCPACGNIYEELKSVSERDNPPPCPRCGGKKAGRKVSTVNGLRSASPSCSMSPASPSPSGTCPSGRGFT